MLQNLGIFKEKQVFCIHYLLNHSRMLGLLTLNHCMIWQLVIVCISFDSF